MTKAYEIRKESNKRYLAKQDSITIRLPKGSKEEIRQHAEARSESINGFIGRAIRETMDRDQMESAQD